MKKFFALLLSIMLLSTAALAEVKIGQVEYAAHGTSCFAVLTVAMDGDTIVAAHIDEFQFMDAATAEGVPNSDASFGQNYPEGKVLASKVVNDGLYSTNMTTKAGATTPLGVSYNAIEAFVTGKTIAELEAAIEGKTKEEWWTPSPAARWLIRWAMCRVCWPLPRLRTTRPATTPSTTRPAKP